VTDTILDFEDFLIVQLRYLRTFLTVATTLNFTKSAQRLHLAQSSVTEQIQALESELGATLFERSARKLTLTAAGDRFVSYAREMLALSEEARAAVLETANAVTGKLAIGALETLCSAPVPLLISKYRARCPQVQVSLRPANSAQLRSGVKEGALDVCFALGAAPADSDLLSEQVADEEVVVIAASTHRLAARSRVTMDDLLKEEFIVTEQGCIYRRMFDDAFAAEQHNRPRQISELGSMSAVCAMVDHGHHCAFVPRLAAANALARGTVVALPLNAGKHTVPVMMHWHARLSARPALQLFLEQARAGF
jgi:DNA-binding transcriptional LysR family regulator